MLGAALAAQPATAATGGAKRIADGLDRRPEHGQHANIIESTTSSLTVSGAETIGAFLDPFLSNPNNFCGAAGAVAAPQLTRPGSLRAGTSSRRSAPTFPVMPLGHGSHAFSDIVTLTGAGSATVNFDFTVDLHQPDNRGHPPRRPAAWTLGLLRHLREQQHRRLYTRGVGRYVSRLHPVRPPAAAIGCVEDALHRRSIILPAAPSRPRWRCSAPPCSASACSAAAARHRKSSSSRQRSGALGRRFFMLRGPRSRFSERLRGPLGLATAVVKNSDRPSPVQHALATRRS